MAFAQNLRQRRTVSRNQRAVERAIRNAPSQTMRNELIAAAQRQRLI